MMTKKKWFIVLCILVLYLLLGTGVFYTIESEEELKRIGLADVERGQIDALLEQLFKPIAAGDQQKMYDMLSNYCGKPLQKNLTDIHVEPKWDFYHALFFVFTVVSTIGYGNLAPTTEFTRIFMIFYALIGIPMNGIVMVTLGTYFGRTFTKLYRRWKNSKGTEDHHSPTTRLGLVSQVILYLVPGFTFFIFLPSAIMVLVENWTYDIAVYYSFVTLTTIGFGDYVAGVDNPNDINDYYYWPYKIFLLVWMVFGLGYVVMVLGFITQALKSKKVRALEHIITKTPLRIRQEMRSLLQEFLFLKVKPVYKGQFVYNPTQLEHTQSCPDLTIYRDMDSPTMARKRALSECPRNFILHHFQSEADLAHIDKDLTFAQTPEFNRQKELLLKVVDALTLMDDHGTGGYENLSDSEILASEGWSPNENKPERRRAISDIKSPFTHKIDMSWPEQEQGMRVRTQSEPTEDDKTSHNLLKRLKNRFTTSRDNRALDVEQNRRRSSMFTSPQEHYLRTTNRGRCSLMSVEEQEAVLEQTSIAAFIRALSAITVPETMMKTNAGPARKLGTASLTPPKSQSPPRTRRPGIRPNPHIRRTSLANDLHIRRQERRFSLRPVQENQVAPPPYSLQPPDAFVRPNRRLSRIGNTSGIGLSSFRRQTGGKEK